ncbi:MAG: hypothetical protein R2939_11305 [Kofleriaceae bacterium]
MRKREQSRRWRVGALSIACVVATSATAIAAPGDGDPDPDDAPPAPSPPADAAPIEAPPPRVVRPPDGTAMALLASPPAPAPLPELELGLLVAPSARMLPGGAITATTGIDTGGGFEGDVRAGLGGVAEFGVATTDRLRVRVCPTCDAGAVHWSTSARFVMGVDDERLFRGQPALALGFEKSFRNAHDARESRFASLYLVASRRVGRAVLHAGGVVWDAELVRDDGGGAVALHDGAFGRMVRPFGGVDILARERAHVMADVSWLPELRLDDGGADRITLRPMLSWGVRYQASPRVLFEAGARVPDIGAADLLDAQIFVQARLVSRYFERAIQRVSAR